jgi:hypothetical protein
MGTTILYGEELTVALAEDGDLLRSDDVTATTKHGCACWTASRTSSVGRSGPV